MSFTATAKGTSNRPVVPINLEPALEMCRHGFWAIPVYPPGVIRCGCKKPTSGKEPIGPAWGLTRRDEAALRDMFSRKPDAGVGICYGPGRAPGGRWLMELEGDGEGAVKSLAILLGTDQEILTPSWDSRRGIHIEFVVDETDALRLLSLLALAGAKEEKGFKVGVWKLDSLPGLEWRIGGYKPGGKVKQVQSVIPPTIGEDGKARAWRVGPDTPLAELPPSVFVVLETLIEWKASKVEAEVEVEQPDEDDEPETLTHPCFTARATGDSQHDAHVAYARAALKKAVDTVATATRENRHKTLLVASLPIAGFVNAGVLTAQEFHDAFMEADRLNHHTEDDGPKDAEDILRTALQIATPRDLSHVGVNRINFSPRQPGPQKQLHRSPSLGAHSVASVASVGNSAASVGVHTLCTKRACDYKVEPVEFVDAGNVLPLKLVTLAGLGGDGKGMFWSNFVADLTKGRPTLGMDVCHEEGVEFLLVGCEDGYEDTVIPRLLAADADLEKVHILEGVKDDKGKILPFSIDYLEPLENWLRQNPNVRAVIIDPITGYVGRAGIEDHNDAELRTVLEPLAVLSKDFRVCVMIIKHLNKDEAKTVSSRVGGSIAYVNVPRACFLVAKDPEDKAKRVIAQFKWNLNAPAPPPFFWTQEPISDDRLAQIKPNLLHLTDIQREQISGQLNHLVWGGESNWDVEDLLKSAAKSERRATNDELERATKWLRERLLKEPVGSILIAMEGDPVIGRKWPGDIVDDDLRRKRVLGRVKWWRENVLKPLLFGEASQAGFHGPWFFRLPCHTWPPSDISIQAANQAQESTEAATPSTEATEATEWPPREELLCVASVEETQIPEHATNGKETVIMNGGVRTIVFGDHVPIQDYPPTDTVPDDRESPKELHARALKHLVGFLMGNPSPRDRVVSIASESGIPFKVLMAAARDLSIVFTIEDGQEIWSLE